ncbi:MAG: hypothetical protein ACR2NC_02585 [Thermodesulfobacteriota bacterium]
MRRFNFILILVFSVALSFIFVPTAISAVSQEIVGTVTLVGDKVVLVKDDSGQIYSFSAPQSKLENVNTGYRVAVKERNNKLVSMEVIGVPAEAKPAIIEIKKTIIKNY